MYPTVAEEENDDPGGGNGNESGGGDVSINGNDRNYRQNMISKARKQGAELQREAAKKKHYFQQKMTLEWKRKQLGKGNIVTFLMSESKQGIEPNEVNKMLRVSGFTTEQVIAIKLCDFRANQIEVLFKDDVQVDILNIEEKLRKENMDIIKQI